MSPPVEVIALAEPMLVCGAIAATSRRLGDEGARRGRAGAVRGDVDDDRHRRGDDVLDDRPHRALEAAGRVDAG